MRASRSRCAAGVVIIAALALGAGAARAATTVPFRTLARGTHSKIASRHELVAATAGTWHLLWYKHSGSADPPAVDMTREMVIAVFAGKQPTDDRSIEIVNILQEGEMLVVHYRAHAPAGPAVTLTAATPFHIVAVRSRATSVTFSEDR